MENRIKEQPWGLFADRTSSSPTPANPLRLYFSAFACVMVERLRRVGWGDGVGAGAGLDLAGQTAEDRDSGPGHHAQDMVVVFRELPVCGVVADGPGPSASSFAWLLTPTRCWEDARLGVCRTDSALESGLVGESTLRGAGWKSNISRDCWVLAFVIPVEPHRRLLNTYGEKIH